jgi:SAM-dependent methyltransferase
MMQLIPEDLSSLPVQTDEELIKQYLVPMGPSAVWIELGCGDATVAKSLAMCFPNIRIKGFEVDEIQHEKNVTSTGTPANLIFELGGMQKIHVPDASVDAVIMLKSLHHVPTELHEQGFNEVYRILKPSGKLLVSEPVFTGDFIEIIRLFHDEQLVQKQAFASLQAQIKTGRFRLENEIHFTSPVNFARGFSDFERKVLKVTYMEHKLSEQTLCTVKELFAKHVQEDGSACFLQPLRLDLLTKL